MNLVKPCFDAQNIIDLQIPGHFFIINIILEAYRNLGHLLCEVCRKVGDRAIFVGIMIFDRFFRISQIAKIFAELAA